MKIDRILVIGACGQIGTELTNALRRKYGRAQVIATDILKLEDTTMTMDPYVQLDVLDKLSLSAIVDRYEITQIYLLAAMLSATGEKYPGKAWQLNTQGLVNVLDLAREKGIAKVFWPSSIAVFGPDAPKRNCPQGASLNPTTMYGISKAAGEKLCQYYHEKHGVDVRSLRYPGLISYQAPPGGGTTDYAVDIFHEALQSQSFTSFLKADTELPMMYMPDAIKATLQLMEAPAGDLRIRSSYNISAMSFTPAQLADAIALHIPEFVIKYKPDERQLIANSWPGSIDDQEARRDWKWEHEYELFGMTREMLQHLIKKAPVLLPLRKTLELLS